ncbi:MAG: M1 family aminopeptidase [Methanosarcina sp.]
MADKTLFLSGFSLLFNEIRLLSRSKLTLISIFLTVLAAVLGLNAIDYANERSLVGLAKTSFTVALGPAQYAAIAGSLLFAVLTLMHLSKDHRHNSTDLLNTSCNYSQVLVFRTAAILSCGIFSVVLGSVALYAVQVFVLRIPFDPAVSLSGLLVITLAGIFFTVLICGGLYLITENLDVSFLTYCILFFMSIGSSNYLLKWVQAPAVMYSDFGGILPVFKLVLYNRLFWIFVSTGIFTTGLLCKRRYESNLSLSLRLNVKQFRVPFLVLLLLGSSLFMYLNEPYINRNDSVFETGLNADESVKLITVLSDVQFFPVDQSLSARVLYEFEKEPGTENIDFITNSGLDIKSLTVNGVEAPASFTKIKGTDRIRVEVPAEARNITIDMSYTGRLKYPSAIGFPGYISEESIYLLENSHWIFEPLTGSKGMIKLAGSVTAPKDLVMVVPGELTGVLEEHGLKTWEYSALSNYFAPGVFAGNYMVKKLQAGSTEIEFYYSPEHREYIEALGIENYLINIVSYYEKNMGSYPYQEYPLKIVESSIYKTGGHSTLNIVTVSEYVFNRELDMKAGKDSDSFSPDLTSLNDITFVGDMNLLAHEIAHQWWGTGVLVEEDSPWSSEGFANYLAYKYVTEEFGSYASEYILAMWKGGVDSMENSYYYTNPEMLENLPEKQRQTYEMQTRSVELYSRMPLLLLRTEELLGEESFFVKLSEIYAEYRFKSLSYEEFLSSLGLSEGELDNNPVKGEETEAEGTVEGEVIFDE